MAAKTVNLVSLPLFFFMSEGQIRDFCEGKVSRLNVHKWANEPSDDCGEYTTQGSGKVP